MSNLVIVDLEKLEPFKTEILNRMNGMLEYVMYTEDVQQYLDTCPKVDDTPLGYMHYENKLLLDMHGYTLLYKNPQGEFNAVPAYSTPQPDRVAEIEARVAELEAQLSTCVQQKDSLAIAVLTDTGGNS